MRDTGLPLLAAAILGAGLSACSFATTTAPITASVVNTSFTSKLPGTYLLFVDAGILDQVVRPAEYGCSAYTFPLSMSASFAESARLTLANLVGKLETIAVPLSAAELAARGVRGQIQIKAEGMSPRLRSVTKSPVSAAIQVDTELSIALIVDGPSGRLLGSTLSGSGFAEGGTGVTCEGGAEVLKQSAEQATTKALTAVGEAMLNAAVLR